MSANNIYTSAFQQYLILKYVLERKWNYMKNRHAWGWSAQKFPYLNNFNVNTTRKSYQIIQEQDIHSFTTDWSFMQIVHNLWIYI